MMLAGIVWSMAVASDSSAQPILNRVEQFLRDQVGGAQQPAPAAAATEPGYLGVTADDAQDAGRGVRVVSVTAGSPAAQAGLASGDLITSIDGQPIRAMDDMARALGGKPAGAKLAITVNRAGVERQQEVTLGRRAQSRLAQPPVETLPDPNAPVTAAVVPPGGPRLGIRTLPVSEEARRQNNLPDGRGAMVISITVGSPAEQAGIPLGAVITGVDNRPVDTPQALASAILEAGGEVELTYVERGQPNRKRVALAGQPLAADGGKLEMRGRPIESPARPKPSDEPTPVAPQNEASQVAALVERIRELEQRVEKLEAALQRPTEEPK
jgi:membrane-associated protease RseP (regulator of RpoE activity)